MAAEVEAYALAAVSQAPEPFRRMLETTFGYRPGIAQSGDWAVTQNGTPNMSVNVAAGRGLVDGSESSAQGMYFCQALTTTNLPISASNPTNPRRDLVVARIRDNEYATGPTSTFALEVITGTPAASPSDPTVPANCLVIARIAVAANATTILTANITDLRTSSTGQHRLTALGGVVVCTSTTKPTVGLWEGLTIYCTDLDTVQVYNGSAWIGAVAGPRTQIFTGSVSNGTATSFTSIITQNNIGTAPFPLTMIVRVTGDQGANGASNTPRMRVTDESGTALSFAGILNGTELIYKNFVTVESKPWGMTVSKDYAAGATMGFRVQYLVDTSNIYIGAFATVEFVPKVS